MKKKYFEPEFEICKLILAGTQLITSDPETTLGEDPDIDD